MPVDHFHFGRFEHAFKRFFNIFHQVVDDVVESDADTFTFGKFFGSGSTLVLKPTITPLEARANSISLS